MVHLAPPSCGGDDDDDDDDEVVASARIPWPRPSSSGRWGESGGGGRARARIEAPRTIPRRTSMASMVPVVFVGVDVGWNWVWCDRQAGEDERSVFGKVKISQGERVCASKLVAC